MFLVANLYHVKWGRLFSKSITNRSETKSTCTCVGPILDSPYVISVKTKMERSKLNITHENGMINIILWDREKTRVIDTISNVRKEAVVLGRASQPSQRRPMDLATLRPYDKKKLQGQILERHGLAEDSARQANLETACVQPRDTMRLPNDDHDDDHDEIMSLLLW